MNLSFSTLSSFLAAAIFSPNVHVVDSQQIEMYDSYACNLFLGEIQCWGDAWPIPTSGTPTFINMPDSESGLPIKIADTWSATLALLDNGKVYGWGANFEGELGASVPSNGITDPAIVQPYDENGDLHDISGVVDIKGGANHACAKHDDKSITCWGYDGMDIDGLNTGPTNEYDGTSESKKADLFDTGSSNTCVVSMDGFMKCYGLLQGIEYNPTTTGNNIIDMQLSGNHVCIMTDAVGSNLLCAGFNQYGQLGNGATTGYSEINSFVSPNGLGNVNSFTLGLSHTCAIQSNDSIMKCWGYNAFSQLGVASDEGNVLTPTEVVVMDGINIGTATILGMQASYKTTFLLLSDNRIFSWGTNDYGLLGIGSTDDSIVAKGGGGAREVLLQSPPTTSPTTAPTTAPTSSECPPPEPTPCKETDSSKFWFHLVVTMEKGKAKIDFFSSKKMSCKFLKRKLDKHPSKETRFCKKHITIGGAWDNCDVTCGYCNKEAA